MLRFSFEATRMDKFRNELGTAQAEQLEDKEVKEVRMRWFDVSAGGTVGMLVGGR